MSFVQLPEPVVHAIKQDSTIWLPWESLPKHSLGSCDLLLHSPRYDFPLLLSFCSASFARRRVLPQLCCAASICEVTTDIVWASTTACRSCIPNPNLTVLLTPHSKQALEEAAATGTPCSVKPRTGPVVQGAGNLQGVTSTARFRREPMRNYPSDPCGSVATTQSRPFKAAWTSFLGSPASPTRPAP